MNKPNHIVYADCPNCGVTIKDISFLPMRTFGNPYCTLTRCPCCTQEFWCRIKVTYEMIIELEDKEDVK